jgi:hypothetical protein
MRTLIFRSWHSVYSRRMKKELTKMLTVRTVRLALFSSILLCLADCGKAPEPAATNPVAAQSKFDFRSHARFSGDDFSTEITKSPETSFSCIVSRGRNERILSACFMNGSTGARLSLELNGIQFPRYTHVIPAPRNILESRLEEKITVLFPTLPMGGSREDREFSTNIEIASTKAISPHQVPSRCTTELDYSEDEKILSGKFACMSLRNRWGVSMNVNGEFDCRVYESQ